MFKVQSLIKEKGFYAKEGEELEFQIRESLDEVRNLAKMMHPSILDEYGFKNALEYCTRQILQRYNISVDYQYICSPKCKDISSHAKIQLYRILQESLTNIMRHANADKVSVVVFQSTDNTTLIIEDNGIGFNVEEINQDHIIHLGLVGMRERTSLLGGEFLVESTLGMGTTIRVKIPVIS